MSQKVRREELQEAQTRIRQLQASTVSLMFFCVILIGVIVMMISAPETENVSGRTCAIVKETMANSGFDSYLENGVCIVTQEGHNATVFVECKSKESESYISFNFVADSEGFAQEVITTLQETTAEHCIVERLR